MPVLTVHHVTTYRYRQPVSFGEHRMMFRPREGHDQRLIESSLEITPKPVSLRWVHDVFGNCVALARFSGRARELCFDSLVRLDHTSATALDFDEVAYSGHVSAGAVNVAVAEAAYRALDGKALLTTIVTANECAARISAATILSPFFRGQTNTHCHLASAAAARLRARDASLAEWTAALGLAFGIMAVPLHHAVVTSDVKALTAAAPVRLALDACEAAAHGLTGSDTVLEHREGLLAQLSAVPLPEAVTYGLGRRWHTAIQHLPKLREERANPTGILA